MLDHEVDLGGGLMPISDMSLSDVQAALTFARSGEMESVSGQDHGFDVPALILRLEIELLIREKDY